ncbi:MAG: ABC transporter permease [Actinomycetia bacterium]|nr:ABC transporter permease [Actinomycetes bacterium]MCP4221799.1 ABC transporter permease [Actinomycetes bacterium]MCP5033026.1 ABC transporter permease [Actinomycetes bacterium]
MNDTAFVLTLAAAVGAAVPIALAALGELLSERAGVLNLGVEGMMLIGAVTAFQVGDSSGSLWLALIAGSIAGAAFASIHAFLSVTLRANQIVSGLALVIFGTGLSTFIGKSIEGLPLDTDFTSLGWGPLSDIPLLGPMFFDQDPMVYATIVFAVLIGFYLNRTRAGLALRAVGESPGTADTMGVAVGAIRYAHVMAGGLFAGMAGAYLVLGQVPSWSQAGTTAGIGWIALALVVFASWKPLRVLLGAFLFGFARRANFWLQGEGVDIPAEFLSMLPYLLTILVLVVWGTRDLRRKVGAPAALGIPYVRDER